MRPQERRPPEARPVPAPESGLTFARGLLLTAAALASAACSAPRPPFLAPSRAVGGEVILFQPEARLGSAGSQPIEEALVDGLIAELRKALTANGLSPSVAPRDPSMERSRRAVIAAWARARAGGRHRLRPDEPLGVEEALLPVREWGADTVVAAVLARRGLFVPEGEYVPRPPGELVVLPDEKSDYEIPRARDYTEEGVSLELLLVDARNGRIVAHRRVTYPAAGDRDIAAVLPRLVRMATRGLTGSP